MFENMSLYLSLFSFQLNIILIFVFVQKFLRWYRFQIKAVQFVEDLIKDESMLSMDKELYKKLITASFDIEVNSYKSFFVSLDEQVKKLIDDALVEERKTFAPVNHISSVDEAIALNQKLEDDLADPINQEDEQKDNASSAQVAEFVESKEDGQVTQGESLIETTSDQEQRKDELLDNPSKNLEVPSQLESDVQEKSAIVMDKEEPDSKNNTAVETDQPPQKVEESPNDSSDDVLDIGSGDEIEDKKEKDR